MMRKNFLQTISLDATIASRRANSNLSYFAFTATRRKLKLWNYLVDYPIQTNPLPKTIRPAAYHVYSMRQAIEEGFILDVLKNYTNYKVAYNLSIKNSRG